MDESWDIGPNLGTTALAIAAQRDAETARDEFAAVLVAAVDEPGLGRRWRIGPGQAAVGPLARRNTSGLS